MASDMFAKLNELLNNVDTIKENESHDKAASKRKVKRKKKKSRAVAPAPDSPYSRSTSPTLMSRPQTASHSIGGMHGHSGLGSPSALKASYPPRPHSALVHSSTYLTQVMSPTRAARPASALPHSGALPSRAAPPGPSAKAQADAAWRDVSPPKYTATSLKKPELGTVPGNYTSPPWKPPVINEVDNSRQEIDFSIKEPRFKHVLAVPAHVLAQSLYHPDCPSDRARAKQLAKDLKTARDDRVQVLHEKAKVDKALASAEQELFGLRMAVTSLEKHNRQLQEQVSGLSKSNKAIAFECTQLHEQLRVLSPDGRHLPACPEEGTDPWQQLAAAQAEITSMKSQIRALQQR